MLKVIIFILLITTSGVFFVTLTRKAPNYTPEEARAKCKETNISISIDNLIEKTVRGDTRVVRLLLQAEVQSEVSYQNIPLLAYALQDGNLEIAELLVKFAKPGHRARNMMWALKNNNFKMVKWLLDRNTDIDFEEDGKGVLYMALHHSSEEVALYLIDKKATIGDYIDVMNQAAKNGWQNFTERMLGTDADVNAGDIKDRTPIIYATLGGQTEMVEYLVSKGADYDVQDVYGITPLMIAAKKNYHEIVRYLISTGANKDLKDKKGRTAASVAASDFIRDILDGQG